MVFRLVMIVLSACGHWLENGTFMVKAVLNGAAGMAHFSTGCGIMFPQERLFGRLERS
jgi:hypothetical protein